MVMLGAFCKSILIRCIIDSLLSMVAYIIVLCILCNIYIPVGSALRKASALSTRDHYLIDRAH